MRSNSKAYSDDKEQNQRLIEDIALSETAKLKYIPDNKGITDFHKFTETVNERIYQPVLNSVYEELRKNLSYQFNEIESFIKTEEIYIPPISAIILNRASKFEEIPEVTLEIRKKFSKTRLALMEYEDALKDINTSLKKRLKILSDLKLINQELAKPYDFTDSLYLNEWVDVWGFLNDLLDGEFSMAKLAGKILGKPMASAIKNVRLRNVAYLFNMRQKMYSITSHNNLVKKFLPKADMSRMNHYMSLYDESKFIDRQKAG